MNSRSGKNQAAVTAQFIAGNKKLNFVLRSCFINTLRESTQHSQQSSKDSVNEAFTTAMPHIDRAPFERRRTYGRWKYAAPPRFPRGWFFDRPNKTIEKQFPNFESPHLTAEQNEANRPWGARVKETLVESHKRRQAPETALHDEAVPSSGRATQVNGLLTPRSNSPVRQTNAQVGQRGHQGPQIYLTDQIREKVQRGPGLVRQSCAMPSKSRQEWEQVGVESYYKTKYRRPDIAKVAYESSLPTDDSFIQLKTSFNGSGLGNSGWMTHRQPAMLANGVAPYPHQSFKNAKDHSSPLSRQWAPKSLWPPPPKLQTAPEYVPDSATLDADFREIFEIPSATDNSDKEEVKIEVPTFPASTQLSCATANTFTTTNAPFDSPIHVSTTHSRKRKADREEREDDRETFKKTRLSSDEEEEEMVYNLAGHGQGIGLGIRGYWAW